MMSRTQTSLEGLSDYASPFSAEIGMHTEPCHLQEAVFVEMQENAAESQAEADRRRGMQEVHTPKNTPPKY